MVSCKLTFAELKIVDIMLFWHWSCAKIDSFFLRGLYSGLSWKEVPYGMSLYGVKRNYSNSDTAPTCQRYLRPLKYTIWLQLLEVTTRHLQIDWPVEKLIGFKVNVAFALEWLQAWLMLLLLKKGKWSCRDLFLFIIAFFNIWIMFCRVLPKMFGGQKTLSSTFSGIIASVAWSLLKFVL